MPLFLFADTLAMKPPDKRFIAALEALGVQVLWDPGANGYAIYGMDIKTAERLKLIAKKYGMKASYWKASECVWVSRKGATFDNNT